MCHLTQGSASGQREAGSGKNRSRAVTRARRGASLSCTHSNTNTICYLQNCTIHTTRVYRKTSMSHASSPGLVCGARTLCAVYAGTARCGMGRQDSGVVELRVRGATVLP